PHSTGAVARLCCSIASAIGSGSGRRLPMQVVQPYPTTLKPSRSKYGISRAPSRYAVTTREPGAMLVLTHGLLVSPRSTARFARRPAKRAVERGLDRKSTRLNSRHVSISYAVFCLKKKNKEPYI